MIPATTAQHEVAITREFDVPREVVYAAWAEVDRMKEWSFTKGMPYRIISDDPAIGGETRYWMDMGEAGSAYGKHTILEAEGPKKLVFKDSFTDEAGNVTRASFMPDWPLEVVYTVAIMEKDGGSTMNLTISPRNATEAETKTFAEAAPGVKECWVGLLDQMDEYFTEIGAKGDNPELAMTYEFSSPAANVFAAFTEKEYVSKWTCPMGYPMKLKELDAKPGGKLHYAIDMPEGEDPWMRQDFLEVNPKRISYTFTFSNEAGEKVDAPFSPSFPKEVLYSMDLMEQDGKCVVKLKALPLKGTPEGMAAFAEAMPMFEEAWNSTFDMVNTMLVTEARAGH